MTNASTADGRGPVDTRALLRAAGEGDAARVGSLLAAGADVNAASEGGETALLRAASKGRLGVVRMLLEAGADPNAEREDGFTALAVAVFFGHAEIVRALLAAGADATARGRLGATAEQWALSRGFGEIVELLRNPDSAGARGSARAARQTVAPAFFPAEGAFSAVVPLSEISESSSALESARGGLGREEQEAVTVIRARVNPATSMARPGLRRRRGARQSWPVTVVVLGLSVFAGLLAGTYLIGSRRSAERRRPAPPAEATGPAAAARLPETSRPAEREPESAVGATVVAVVEDDSRDETASRGAAGAESSAGQSPSPAAGVKAADGRRSAGAGRRARRTEGRTPGSPQPGNSPPLSSPTPLANSEKSKVIQWP